MGKLNQKGLKQPKQQKQAQAMQQQAQQPSLAEMIQSAIQEDGLTLEQVVEELKFNEVDDQMIMQALTQLGIKEEQIASLFKPKSIENVDAQEMFQMQSQLPKAQFGVPRKGETNSEFLRRTTGNPGFYNNTAVWDGQKFVNQTQKNNTNDQDSVKELVETLSNTKGFDATKLLNFIQQSEEEQQRQQIINTPFSAIQGMISGFKDIGRGLGIGKKNKLIKEERRKFQEDPQEFFKNTFIGYNPTTGYDVLIGNPELMTDEQRKYFVEQGIRAQDLETNYKQTFDGKTIVEFPQLMRDVKLPNVSLTPTQTISADGKVSTTGFQEFEPEFEATEVVVPADKIGFDFDTDGTQSTTTNNTVTPDPNATTVTPDPNATTVTTPDPNVTSQVTQPVNTNTYRFNFDFITQPLSEFFGMDNLPALNPTDAYDIYRKQLKEQGATKGLKRESFEKLWADRTGLSPQMQDPLLQAAQNIVGLPANIASSIGGYVQQTPAYQYALNQSYANTLPINRKYEFRNGNFMTKKEYIKNTENYVHQTEQARQQLTPDLPLWVPLAFMSIESGGRMTFPKQPNNKKSLFQVVTNSFPTPEEWSKLGLPEFSYEDMQTNPTAAIYAGMLAMKSKMKYMKSYFPELAVDDPRYLPVFAMMYNAGQGIPKEAKNLAEAAGSQNVIDDMMQEQYMVPAILKHEDSYAFYYNPKESGFKMNPYYKDGSINDKGEITAKGKKAGVTDSDVRYEAAKLKYENEVKRYFDKASAYGKYYKEYFTPKEFEFPVNPQTAVAQDTSTSSFTKNFPSIQNPVPSASNMFPSLPFLPRFQTLGEYKLKSDEELAEELLKKLRTQDPGAEQPPFFDYDPFNNLGAIQGSFTGANLGSFASVPESDINEYSTMIPEQFVDEKDVKDDSLPDIDLGQPDLSKKRKSNFSNFMDDFITTTTGIYKVASNANQLFDLGKFNKAFTDSIKQTQADNMMVFNPYQGVRDVNTGLTRPDLKASNYPIYNQTVKQGAELPKKQYEEPEIGSRPRDLLNQIITYTVPENSQLKRKDTETEVDIIMSKKLQKFFDKMSKQADKYGYDINKVFPYAGGATLSYQQTLAPQGQTDLDKARKLLRVYDRPMVTYAYDDQSRDVQSFNAVKYDQFGNPLAVFIPITGKEKRGKRKLGRSLREKQLGNGEYNLPKAQKSFNLDPYGNVFPIQDDINALMANVGARGRFENSPYYFQAGVSPMLGQFNVTDEFGRQQTIDFQNAKAEGALGLSNRGFDFNVGFEQDLLRKANPSANISVGYNSPKFGINARTNVPSKVNPFIYPSFNLRYNPNKNLSFNAEARYDSKKQEPTANVGMKYNFQFGGRVVDVNTNMIAKLLAAGADIEIL